MKRLLPLLLCLLLLGCGKESNAPSEAAPTESAPAISVPQDAPMGLYDPDSPLERASQGALRVYPLRFSTITAMRTMGENLLIFSAGEKATAITMLSGPELHVTASTVVDCPLDLRDPSLQIWPDTLSYFDGTRGETVVLDRTLKEVSRMALPETLMGTPLLSSDRNTLCYCTPDAIRAWDLETGLHRCVKELGFDSQAVTGLHVNDTILQCLVLDGGQEKTLLLSARDGRLLYEGIGALSLSTVADRFFAALPAGNLETLVFGRGETETHILSPLDIQAQSFFLPEKNGVVTASSLEDRQVRLDYYDLETGSRVSTLTLPGGGLPLDVEAGTDGSLYVLRMDGSYKCEVIYRWEVTGSALSAQDSHVYSGPFYSPLEPDEAGLAECQALASALGSKYGMEILLWQDALAVQPQDCAFQGEYLIPVLRQELTLLEERLSRFPGDILEQAASHFSSLRLCLVRQIDRAGREPSEPIGGVQFLDGADAYIAIAVGRGSEEVLYRELYSMMDTHVLSKSTALYRWEEENPKDFAYSFGDEALRNGGYLEGKDQAFVDMESQHSPKEDRARVFARAMMPGQLELFQHHTLQRKLRLLCEGIRNACGLRKSTQVLPWEQYLQTPLAYQK